LSLRLDDTSEMLIVFIMETIIANKGMMLTVHFICTTFTEPQRRGKEHVRPCVCPLVLFPQLLNKFP
jgi:hypothetical protein